MKTHLSRLFKIIEISHKRGKIERIKIKAVKIQANSLKRV
jgi:hypothetical protein